MTLERICKFCFTTPAFTIDFAGKKGMEACIACIDEWSELRLPAENRARIIWMQNGGWRAAEVNSLYAYRGLMRRHIIAAKVQGDHTAVRRLVSVWESALDGLPEMTDFSAVMPCPSSLWSRMHGKFDLAWIFAAYTAQRFGIQLIRPPRRLYWSFRKRARMDRPVDNMLINTPADGQISELTDNFRERCLLIDDVVTTGATLRRCLEGSPPERTYHYSVLTLARSRGLTL